MPKIRRISDLQHEFSFLSSSENFQLYFDQFLASDLGKIYTAIPWDKLVSIFKIKESIKGTKNYFSPKGKLALMFLKHYACCSDKKLIAQLNANIDYQFFCDIHLGYSRLTNYKIVSQIRCELASNLHIEDIEKMFYSHWKAYGQQYLLFTTGEKPKGRIVSLSKHYLRPIVRGKEIKGTEFGAKVNKLQIDGINFIQKISFDNFNEGTQFKNTIYKAQGLAKTKVKVAGADAIYATNKNRVFATSNKIQTDFKPKGRLSKHYKEQKKLKAMITKERASRLEGSFGKEKEHYLLKRIKAKTKATEILWIFFGIHTANCLEIGRRIQQQNLKKSFLSFFHKAKNLGNLCQLCNNKPIQTS